MARKQKVFNSRKRRVYRTFVPKREALYGGLIVIVLVLSGFWFASKKDDFNPGERDISIAVLEEGAVEDNLYRTPLQPWNDPDENIAGTTSSPRYRLGLFPQSILEGGWTPSSRLQQFNESNLFEKINGAAPQYFQFGFQALHFISIKNPDSDLELSIELYDMGEIANAIGIFAAQRDDDQALKKLENAHFFSTSVGAIGILNHFYFKITGNQRDSQAVEKSISIVEALNDIESDSGRTSKIFDVFANRLNIPFARITYERQDVFQFDFAKDFWFARPPSASDYRYFAHESASQEEARELYDRLLEENLFDNTLVSQKDQSVVMKHNFLNTLLSLNLNDTTVFGVENAPDETVLRRSLRSLSEALFE